MLFGEGAEVRPHCGLDEFDPEAAALLREHLRLPGLGQTATYYFRDKLTMRTLARCAGIAVPDFTAVVNYADLRGFLAETEGPWLLKPRTNASAIGIKPVARGEELWPILDALGDLQTHYLLECFVAGAVCHVEGVTWGGRLLFSQPFAENATFGEMLSFRVIAKAASGDMKAISALLDRVEGKVSQSVALSGPEESDRVFRVITVDI